MDFPTGLNGGKMNSTVNTNDSHDITEDMNGLNSCLSSNRDRQTDISYVMDEGFHSMSQKRRPSLYQLS